MKILAAIALALVAAIPAQAQTKDLTGTWVGGLTRTAPDGRTQTIDFQFNLTQKGKVITGTVGPNADRQWTIEKGGAIEGGKITFKVQQPDGPLRTFTLAVVKERLQGEMIAEFNGQSFTTTVDAERQK